MATLNEEKAPFCSLGRWDFALSELWGRTQTLTQTGGHLIVTSAARRSVFLGSLASL